eukprot:12282592-Heterocapsa_arctica.AAC.1
MPRPPGTTTTAGTHRVRIAAATGISEMILRERTLHSLTKRRFTLNGPRTQNKPGLRTQTKQGPRTQSVAS